MNPYPKSPHIFEDIYAVVKLIPPGKVATYGQIGKIVSGCCGRIVGFAMAGLRGRQEIDVPWHRVINREGRLSLNGMDSALQRALLEDEGVVFNQQGQIDLATYKWQPD